MAHEVLALDSIVKRYGDVPALGPVSFTVEEGEFLTLLGPSGCGKTTTLHVIAGLLEPDGGRLSMRGGDITALPTDKRGMGVVFQNYALFPHKTVEENIGFGLRMRRVPKPQIGERVREMLDIVGLPGVEARYPRQLSGGQRQRVALARAMVIHPPVLLLDEPLSNLDALLRKQMRSELRAIQRRIGITAIYVTHDQDEAFEMSDRVILLNQGRIEQIGTPERLYDRPATRFAAEFIGDANLIEGEVVETDGGIARIRAAGAGTIPAISADSGFAIGSPVYLVVRPERIRLSARPPDDAALAATITDRVFTGENVRITVTTEGGAEFRCIKPSLPLYRGMQRGDRVWALPEECHAISREA